MAARKACISDGTSLDILGFHKNIRIKIIQVGRDIGAIPYLKHAAFNLIFKGYLKYIEEPQKTKRSCSIPFFRPKKHLKWTSITIHFYTIHVLLLLPETLTEGMILFTQMFIKKNKCNQYFYICTYLTITSSNLFLKLSFFHSKVEITSINPSDNSQYKISSLTKKKGTDCVRSTNLETLEWNLFTLQTAHRWGIYLPFRCTNKAWKCVVTHNHLYTSLWTTCNDSNGL